MVITENTPINFFQIWKHFDEGRWFLPIHQRKLVWDKQKIKEWHKTIEAINKAGGGIVEGCVIIYQLPGENKIYLNDGAQRVYWTILKFIEHCKIHEKDWKEILGSVSITVQKVQYLDVAQAIKGFIRINFGTTATPYELTRTLMCETLEDYSNVWESRLNKIQRVVLNCMQRLNAEVEDREDVSKRELAHKRIRDELHLFWKFISKDKSLWSPQVALSNLKPEQWAKHTKLEKQLIENLKEIGIGGFDIAFKSFEKWMEDQTALYYQIWEEIRPPAERPANVHMRWWFASAVLLYNIGRQDKLREFTEKLIKHSDGRTTIFYKTKDGKQCNCNCAMCNLKQLGMICNIIGFKFPEEKIKRKKSKRLLKKGFCESHIDSIQLYGEGPTLAENNIDNRLRSAESMTDEEVRRLNAFNKTEIPDKS